MNENKILEQITSCKDCKNCLNVCDTYLVTENIFQSPNGRLKIAEKVFKNEDISENELIAVYTCTLCASCDVVCSQNINISDIIHSSKIKLVDKNEGPLEIHNKIIQGIIEERNSVGGKHEARLNWFPEKFRSSEIFEKKDSDTLLFFGCMSSFRIKESASAPYEILRKANYNFKILEDEPCCGEYIYSSGKVDLANKIFHENLELFKKLGIKNLIVTCGGCLYAFDTVYRKYLKNFDLKVRHIIDVIYELVVDGKIELNPLNKSILYHDPCRLGRKYKNGPLFKQPRELLKKCSIDFVEFTKKHEQCPCCGAGSGIRGVDSSLCIKIGERLFKNVDVKEISSSCPLCVFNFRYVLFKNQIDKESKYITDYILESMEK